MNTRFLWATGTYAVLALLALGYKPVEAHDAMRAALAVLGEPATVEELVRVALKQGAR